jgi:hypothetical protein
MDPWIPNLSQHLNDDLFINLFFRRGKGMAVKSKVENGKDENCKDEEDSLLTERKMLHKTN